ncbi:MAG: serine kinase [Fidelibacterota bacterium]|nr:MAG: serine kinase [Candidatus Neomarinimicrobiota bacterium]
MKIQEIKDQLSLSVIVDAEHMDREVTGGYVSDMLSDVIANAEAGSLWITLQTHLNIIPVASLKDLAGIVIVNGRRPDEETLSKARQEKVLVLGTELQAFEVAGRLYQLVIGNKDEDV